MTVPDHTPTTEDPMTEDKAPLSALEEEGDIAADYLEELLDIADYEGDIDIDVENGRASLEIVSEEFGDRWLRRLVGDDGEVLEALQELTRLAVQTRTGERSRLMLDIAGHRDKRRVGPGTERAERREERRAGAQPLRRPGRASR